MEDKRERPRVYTKTFLLYSQDEGNFVGKICRAMKAVYYAVKVGQTTHMCVTDDPVPQAFVISIGSEGAYRVIDRDESVYFMITGDGVEVATGRWPKYQFESVDVVPRFCSITVKGQEVETELKVGRGVGNVKPYTELMAIKTEGVCELPGIKFLNIEGDVREARAKLKEERGQRDEIILTALKESNADRGIARFMGLRNDKVMLLENVSKIEVGSPSRRIQTPRAVTPISAFTPIVPQQSKTVILPESTAAMYSAMSGISKVDVTYKEPLSVDVGSDFFGDEYRRLVHALEAHPDVRNSHESVSFAMPTRMSSFENTMFEMKTQLNNVPLYQLDTARSEYKYLRNGVSSKVVVVLQGGQLVALPEA
nr:NS2 [Sathuvachari virus]